MIELYDNDSGNLLGNINDEQLQFLIDQLEEESAEDKDYWLNRDSLAQFAEKGCPPALLELLPEVPFVWLEFQTGPMGVFAIERRDLLAHADAIRAAAAQREKA